MSKPYLSQNSESESSEKSLQGAEDKEAAKHEPLENKLTLHDFVRIQQLFMSLKLIKPACMNREEFVKQTHQAVGHGTQDEYGELFDKIDVTRDGLIDWDKLTSFMLLELYEKDERAKTLAVPQWKDLRLLSPIHKETVQKVVYLKGYGRYLTLSRDGLLGVWGENLKFQRSLRITTDSVKLKDLWVTSMVSLGNANKIAVAFTSKEICFYELNSKQEFACQYKVQGLDGTPICLEFWSNPDDGNEAVLTFGDVSGQVHGLCFTIALIALFERPANTNTDQETTMTINWHELLSGHHKCCYVLRHKLHGNNWVRQVSFNGSLEAFLSCTTSDTNTMVVAWVERGKSKPKLRTTSVDISQGIHDFDCHPGLNLIATAGVDQKICLWNPYVMSKPTGVLQGNRASVIAVQFIMSRRQLLSFSKDKVLRLWDIHHQLCLQRIANIFPKTLEFYLGFYFYEAHGRLFISFNNHLTMLEMKLETGKKVTSHEKAVTCVLYNSLFKQVISSDTGSTVNFFMIATGQKVKQFTRCHGNAEISTMVLDACGTRLLTGSTDGTVKIWDFNGHCHYKLNAGGDQAAEISQILVLKRTILVVGWERIITVFRMNTLTQFFVQPTEWKGGVQHQDDILYAAFLPPQSLVTGSYDGEIVIWNNNTENASRKLHHDPRRALKSKSASPVLQPPRRSSSTLSGRRSVSTGGCYDSEADCNYAVTRLFFLEARKNLSATGGANLVSCGGSGYVRFWNIFNSKLVAEFLAHSEMGSIIMTIDEKNEYLITADLDGWVKIWNIQDYCLDFSEDKEVHPPPLVKAYQPHEDCVTHLQTCEQDGHFLIISASADCNVCLSSIQGTKVGVFGQEEHWQIKNYLTPPGVEQLLDNSREERVIKLSDENLNIVNSQHTLPAVEENELPYKKKRITMLQPPLGLCKQSATPQNGCIQGRRSSTESSSLAGSKSIVRVNAAIFVSEFRPQYSRISPWENTILGKQYKESNMQKEKPPVLYSEETVRNSIGTFSSLNIGTLEDIVEMNKPDFVLNPEKYFGEKPEHKSFANVKLPTLTETLKAVFDEKSLFPKEILERGRKVQPRNEGPSSAGKIKIEKKPGRLSEKLN